MNKTEAAPVFVVFEGLDGAGKTTCAQRLAEHMGAEFITTPPTHVREISKQIIENYERCQEARQLFYLSTVFSASDQVKALLSAGQSAVIDRYFLSTQVYAKFRSSNLELDEWHTKLTPASLTVFLDAPLAVRAERIARRRSDAADAETLREAADRRLRQLYMDRARLAIAGKWLVLDSATLSVTAIVEEILEALRS